MRLKINEDIQHCWFGYYLNVKGDKKYFYMTKDSTSRDPDEASEIMEDSIPEPFTKFVFQGSVANTQAEKQGWKLVESSNSELEMRKQNYEKAKADFENYGEEDNNDVLSREEKMLIAKAELDKVCNINENIQVGDTVKVSTPGNKHYDGRTGIVDYIDDVITVLFNDGKSPKLNNFDINQVCKIDESSTCHKLSENYWIDNKEVMDEVDRLGKELADDGWNSYADKYTGKAYYWIFVKRENDKVIAKAIIYNHNIKPEVIDITIDQAIGQSSLDSNDALRRNLGKMLLPQNESGADSIPVFGAKAKKLTESYIEIDNAVDTIDELGYSGAVEIKDNKVFADETTLRQIIDKLDYTPNIMMTMDEYSKSHAPKNEAISKATHCVYFNQDGWDQIEFEGTEDECYNYIASIESEQDDEFGDEAPERFIKKINEEIYDQNNHTEIVKESIDTANIEAIANANDSKVVYYNTWNELLKERDTLCKSHIRMLKGGSFVSVIYRQMSSDICWPFDERIADSLEKLFEKYPRYKGLDVCIAKELLDKNTENINESPELIPIEIVDLENVDEQFSDDTVKELEKYFKENNAAYILDELYYSKPRNVIEFDINNGDWKHEHLWAKRLIQEFFEKLDMDISIESFETQTDGSDCYSAHYTIYPGIKKSYTADIKESAIEEDYTPGMLDDLVNHYAGRTDFATIWDEITNKFNDEDLANDVIEALELQASDLWEKYLTESKELSTDHAIISVVDQVKAVYEAGLFDKLPVGRDRALTLDIFGPDKDRLAGYFKKQPEFNYEMNNENGIISHEFISDKYDIEVFDSFIQMYKIPQNESIAPDGYEPNKKGKAYKVFKVKNGKLYPPMVANPGGEDTPIGVWLTADEGEFAGLSKTGRPQVKSTGSGTLSYRPGWHLGDIPRASQFDRTNKETGEKEFPKDFVWAECEYTMDVDYQPESDEQGYMRTDKDGNQYRSDKYQHSLAGLPKMPKDGYYKYRTNPRPDTVPWVITGAIKVNKLLSDDEVNEILAKHGIEPIHRQGGDKTLAELGL